MTSKILSLEEIYKHNQPDDLWTIIDNKVYNLTKFRSEHPGGEETLDEAAGKDSTKDFNDVGHSSDAKELMKKYYIGDLNPEDIQCKFTREIKIAVGALLTGIAVVFLVRKIISSRH